MNHRRISWGFSQFLAALVVVAAVLLMMAPFRGAGNLTRLRTAGVLPVLSTASIAHGASFQAFHTRDRVAVSEAALFRSAISAKGLQRREIVVRKSAGPTAEMFQAPRQEWRHLDRGLRARLDELAANWKGDSIELRATGLRRGGLAEMERLTRTLVPVGMPQGTLVIGNGAGCRDGEVQVRSGAPPSEGPLKLYLAGDFHWQAPTRAQWEALDEVLDYLELKCGQLHLRLQGHQDETATGAGLGPLFPAESLLRALSASSS